MRKAKVSNLDILDFLRKVYASDGSVSADCDEARECQNQGIVDISLEGGWINEATWSPGFFVCRSNDKTQAAISKYSRICWCAAIRNLPWWDIITVVLSSIGLLLTWEMGK